MTTTNNQHISDRSNTTEDKDRAEFEAWCDDQIFPIAWKEDKGAFVSWKAAREFSCKELESNKQQISCVVEDNEILLGDLEAAKQRIAELEREILIRMNDREAAKQQKANALELLYTCLAEKEDLEKKLAVKVEQISVLYLKLSAENKELDARNEELTKLLSAARQQGFEEGSKIREKMYELGRQAGRDELQKELSEKEPVAYSDKTYNLISYSDTDPRCAMPLIHRPLPPQAKG